MNAEDHETVERLTARFDHHDPAFDPETAQNVHRELRERCPVAFSSAHGGMWLLTRYEDVQKALKDHQTFSSASGVFFPRASGTPHFAPLEYDPPEQSAFRKLMRPPFTQANIKALEPDIAGLIAAHVRPLVAGRKADMVRSLSVPLPLAVVSLAVGFTNWAQERIRDLTRATWQHMPRDNSPEGFWPQFTELLDHEIIQARTRNGDDYLSWLVHQKLHGRSLTRPQLHVILVALAIAGHETTMNAISHMLWFLARSPSLQIRIRQEPKLADVVVEESLRMWPPVDHGSRLTTAEVSVGDTTIPERSRVLMLTGAANHDPRQFPDPDTFRTDREANRHLSFGFGIHFCLGAHLARAELRLLLEELARHPAYELRGQPRRSYENGRHMGIDQLPVRFLEGGNG